MSTIVELQQRAAALKAKYQKESITPEEIGQLHEDTLAYMADLERYVDNLGVRKTYASKAEMDADIAPVGTNGKAMKFGQLAVIRSSDTENGNVFAFQNPGWLPIGNLSEGKVVNDLATGGENVPLSAEQGKVLNAKIEAVKNSIPNKDVDELEDVIYEKVNSTITPINTQTGYIALTTGLFTAAGATVHGVSSYDVKEGDIINATNVSCAYQGALSFSVLASDGSVVAKGVSMNKSTDTSKALYTIDNLVIPSGGVTLMISNSSYTASTPLSVSKISTTSIKNTVDSLKLSVDKNTSDIQSLNTSMLSIPTIQNDLDLLDVTVNGGNIDTETDVTSKLPKYSGASLFINNTISASTRCSLYLVDVTINKVVRIYNATGDQVNGNYMYLSLNITASEFLKLAKGTDLTSYIVTAGPKSADMPSAILPDSDWITFPDAAKCVVVSNYSVAATLRVLQKIKKTYQSLQSQIDSINSTNNTQRVVTLIGDSTMGSPKIFINNWCKKNGYSINIIQQGGNNALQLGAYVGAIPVVLKNSVTIPTSGSVALQLKSTCTGIDGKLIDLVLKHYNVEDTTFTLGLNPVTINGVQGNISHDTSLKLASVCFYDSAGALIKSYDATSQGKELDVNITGVASMRVCINANTQNDVLANTAHVDINGNASIDFIPYLNNANTCLDITGNLLTNKIGFYTSDKIVLTDTTITKLYMDGLADNVNVLFTRLTAGDAMAVESGASVYSTKYEQYKDTVVLYYLNNIHRTGGAIEDDFVKEMLPVSKLSDRFIMGTSHWFPHSFTADQIPLIEGKMHYNFGYQYINMYRYMSESGISDIQRFGVLTSEQIGTYDWEHVFLTSSEPIGATINVHENIYGAYLIARKFLQRGADLGYWQLGDISFRTLYNDGKLL